MFSLKIEREPQKPKTGELIHEIRTPEDLYKDRFGNLGKRFDVALEPEYTESDGFKLEVQEAKERVKEDLRFLNLTVKIANKSNFWKKILDGEVNVLDEEKLKETLYGDSVNIDSETLASLYRTYRSGNKMFFPDSLRIFFDSVDACIDDARSENPDVNADTLLSFWKEGGTDDGELDDNKFAEIKEEFGHKIRYVEEAVLCTSNKVSKLLLSESPVPYDSPDGYSGDLARIFDKVVGKRRGDIVLSDLPIDDFTKKVLRKGALGIEDIKEENFVERFELRFKADFLHVKLSSLKDSYLEFLSEDREYTEKSLEFYINELSKIEEEKSEIAGQFEDSLELKSVKSILGSRVSDKELSAFRNSIEALRSGNKFKAFVEISKSGSTRRLSGFFKSIESLNFDEKIETSEIEEIISSFGNDPSKIPVGFHDFVGCLRNLEEKGDSIDEDEFKSKIIEAIRNYLKYQSANRSARLLSRMERSRLFAGRVGDGKTANLIGRRIEEFRDFEDTLKEIEFTKLNLLINEQQREVSLEEKKKYIVSSLLVFFSELRYQADGLIELINKLDNKTAENAYELIRSSGSVDELIKLLSNAIESKKEENYFEFRPDLALAWLVTLLSSLQGQAYGQQTPGEAGTKWTGYGIGPSGGQDGVNIYPNPVAEHLKNEKLPDGLENFLYGVELELDRHKTPDGALFHRSSLLLARGKLTVSLPSRAPGVLDLYMTRLDESERASHISRIAEKHPDLVVDGRFAPNKPLTVRQYIDVFKRFIQETSEYDDVIKRNPKYLDKDDLDSFYQFSRDINSARQARIDKELDDNYLYEYLIDKELDEDARIYKYGLTIINLMRGDHHFALPRFNPESPNFRENTMKGVRKFFEYVKYMYKEYYQVELSTDKVNDMLDSAIQEIENMNPSEFRELLRRHRGDVWKLSESIMTHYLIAKRIDPIDIDIEPRDFDSGPDMEPQPYPDDGRDVPKIVGEVGREFVGSFSVFPTYVPGGERMSGNLLEGVEIPQADISETVQQLRDTFDRFKKGAGEIASDVDSLGAEFQEAAREGVEGAKGVLRTLLDEKVTSSELYGILEKADPRLEDAGNNLESAINGLSTDPDSWVAFASSLEGFFNAYSDALRFGYRLAHTAGMEISREAVEGAEQSLNEFLMSLREKGSGTVGDFSQEIFDRVDGTRNLSGLAAQDVSSFIRANSLMFVENFLNEQNESIRAVAKSIAESFDVSGYFFGEHFEAPSKLAVSLTPRAVELYKQYLGEDLEQYFERRGRSAGFEKDGPFWDFFSLSSLIYDYNRLIDAMKEQGVPEDELPSMGEMIDGFRVAYSDSENSLYWDGMTTFEYSFTRAENAEGNPVYIIEYAGTLEHKGPQDVAKDVVLPQGRIEIVNPEVSENEDGTRTLTYEKAIVRIDNPDATAGPDQSPLIVEMSGVNIQANEKALPTAYDLIVNNESTEVSALGKKLTPKEWVSFALSQIASGRVSADSVDYTTPDGGEGMFRGVLYSKDGDAYNIKFNSAEVLVKNGFEGEETNIFGKEIQASKSGNTLREAFYFESDELSAKWLDNFFNSLDLYVKAKFVAGVTTEAELRATILEFASSEISLFAKNIFASANMQDATLKAEADKLVADFEGRSRDFFENVSISISPEEVAVGGSWFTIDDKDGFAKILEDVGFEYRSLRDYALSGAVFFGSATQYAEDVLKESMNNSENEGSTIEKTLSRLKETLTLKGDGKGIFVAGSVEDSGGVFRIGIDEALARNWNEIVSMKIEELSAKYTDDQINLALEEFSIFLNQENQIRIIDLMGLGAYIDGDDISLKIRSLEYAQISSPEPLSPDEIVDTYIENLSEGLKQGDVSAGLAYAYVRERKEELKKVILRNLEAQAGNEEASVRLGFGSYKSEGDNYAYQYALQKALMSVRFSEDLSFGLNAEEFLFSEGNVNELLADYIDSQNNIDGDKLIGLQSKLQDNLLVRLNDIETQLKKTEDGRLSAKLAVEYALLVNYKSILLAQLNGLSGEFDSEEGSINISVDKIKSVFKTSLNEALVKADGSGINLNILWKGSDNWGIRFSGEDLDVRSENKRLAMKGFLMELSQKGFDMKTDSILIEGLSDQQKRLLEAFGFNLKADETGKVTSLSIEQILFMNSIKQITLDFLESKGVEIKDGKLVDVDRFLLTLKSDKDFGKLLDVLLEKTVTADGEESYSGYVELADVLSVYLNGYIKSQDIDMGERHSIEDLKVKVSGLVEVALSDIYKSISKEGEVEYGAQKIIATALEGVVKASIEKIIRKYKTDGTTNTTIENMFAEVLDDIKLQFKGIDITEGDDFLELMVNYIKINSESMNSVFTANGIEFKRNLENRSFVAESITFSAFENMFTAFLRDAGYRSSETEGGRSSEYFLGGAEIAFMEQLKLSLRQGGFLRIDKNTGDEIVMIKGNVTGLYLEIKKALELVANGEMYYDSNKGIMTANIDAVLSNQENKYTANAELDLRKSGPDMGRLEASGDFGSWFASLGFSFKVEGSNAKISIFEPDSDNSLFVLNVELPDNGDYDLYEVVEKSLRESKGFSDFVDNMNKNLAEYAEQLGDIDNILEQNGSITMTPIALADILKPTEKSTEFQRKSYALIDYTLRKMIEKGEVLPEFNMTFAEVNKLIENIESNNTVGALDMVLQKTTGEGLPEFAQSIVNTLIGDPLTLQEREIREGKVVASSVIGAQVTGEHASASMNRFDVESEYGPIEWKISSSEFKNFLLSLSPTDGRNVETVALSLPQLDVHTMKLLIGKGVEYVTDDGYKIRLKALSGAQVVSASLNGRFSGESGEVGVLGSIIANIGKGETVEIPLSVSIKKEKDGSTKTFVLPMAKMEIGVSGEDSPIKASASLGLLPKLGFEVQQDGNLSVRQSGISALVRLQTAILFAEKTGLNLSAAYNSATEQSLLGLGFNSKGLGFDIRRSYVGGEDVAKAYGASFSPGTKIGPVNLNEVKLWLQSGLNKGIGAGATVSW